ncbi:DJ-1/PfpI family protein [Ampelomyces quisqualis]|uniref:DJ-1/PfpI family protein n=1 Tax=Ampelomyces quisqualis TaxID=50730 RepID=A0A6A5QNH0_AMPQU|nr:DJ-1/PfpI family protein [Ampelomyces quisqualis]
MRLSGVAPLLAALPSALGRLSQPPIANTTKLPTHYGLLLFPHFQALDVFGPLDVFNNLAMMYKNSTTMYLSVLSKTMAPVTTGMTGLPGSFEQRIVPTTTFTEYLNGTRPPPTNLGDIEVLIIPGGGGTRSNMTEEIAFVKQIYPKVKYIITICTGSTIVSRTGILDGRKATTNKFSWAWAVKQGPKVNWVPTARWVEDGNIFSSSGVSAGIDVAYAFVSRMYGEPVANYLAQAAEYNRETDPHHDPFSTFWEVPGST